MSGPARIVVHAGMHKTGTTALQRLLADARGTLLEHGVLYPGTAPHHNPLLNTRHPDWEPAVIQRALRHGDEAGVETVLLSAEVVSTLSDEQLDVLFRAIPGRDLTFVIAFRHWCGYLPSRWTQNCWRRDSQAFRAYLEALRRPGPPHIDLRFDAVLARFAARAEVAAVSYSNAVDADGSIASALLGAMNLAPQLVTGLLAYEAPVNVRRDWVAVETLRLLNGFVSHRLGRPQNTLFETLRHHQVIDGPYDLPVHRFEPEVVAPLAAVVRDHETTITLSSNDAWIRALDAELQQRWSECFTNLAAGRIFASPDHSEVRCTDLEWSDVDPRLMGEVVACLDAAGLLPAAP